SDLSGVESRSPRGQVGAVQAGTGSPQVNDGTNARGTEPARTVAADVRADEGVAEGAAAGGNPPEAQLKKILMRFARLTRLTTPPPCQKSPHPFGFDITTAPGGPIDPQGVSSALRAERRNTIPRARR